MVGDCYMYKTAKEFIENEIPVKVRINLCPIFQAGIKAYNDIISSDYDLFKSDYGSNIYGQLKTFVIYRQFEKDMLSEKFPFDCDAQKVNGFKYKVPKLVRGNGMFLVCRAQKAGVLPKESKYKKEYCRKNMFECRQLKIDLDSKKMPIISSEKYLAFITYGIKNNELEFVNLVVPDKDMKECLYYIDLKHEFDMYLRNINNDQQQEETRIASLKKEWSIKTQ